MTCAGCSLLQNKGIESELHSAILASNLVVHILCLLVKRAATQLQLIVKLQMPAQLLKCDSFIPDLIFSYCAARELLPRVHGLATQSLCLLQVSVSTFFPQASPPFGHSVLLGSVLVIYIDGNAYLSKHSYRPAIPLKAIKQVIP